MKIIYIITALFFVTITAVNAQNPLSSRENRRPVLVDDVNGQDISALRYKLSPLDNLGLSDKQREEITSLQVKLEKDLNKLNNQLNAKQICLHTLETQAAVNMKSVNKNIDEQVKLLAQQMKLKAKHKQQIRKILDGEQRRQFDESEL